MAAEGAWLDLAPRKHRDRHGPMGPDDSSATAASKTGTKDERRGRPEWPGAPRGLGNEDEESEEKI